MIETPLVRNAAWVNRSLNLATIGPGSRTGGSASLDGPFDKQRFLLRGAEPGAALAL